MRASLFIGIVVFGMGCAAQAQAVKRARQVVWPVPAPVSKEFHLEDHTQQTFKIEINDMRGKLLYLLDGAINAWDFANNDFDYSGDFECRLTEIGVKHSENLLAEDEHATRDWQSRGRFQRQELEGKCWEYPDYGHKRCFRLRGMELCIEVSQFEVGNEITDVKVKRFKNLVCKVTVVPDESAKREVAEWSKHLEPPKAKPESMDDMSLDCSKIIKK